jgi:hypothetical protein
MYGVHPKRRMELTFIRLVSSGIAPALAAKAAGFHYNSGWKLRQRLAGEILAHQRTYARHRQQHGLHARDAQRLIDAVLSA